MFSASQVKNALVAAIPAKRDLTAQTDCHIPFQPFEPRGVLLIRENLNHAHIVRVAHGLKESYAASQHIPGRCPREPFHMGHKRPAIVIRQHNTNRSSSFREFPVRVFKHEKPVCLGQQRLCLLREFFRRTIETSPLRRGPDPADIIVDGRANHRLSRPEQPLAPYRCNLHTTILEIS